MSRFSVLSFTGDSSRMSDVAEYTDRTDSKLRSRCIAVAALAFVGLTSCTSTAAVESAPHAHDPVCAEVMLGLPDEVGDLTQRTTGSQGTSVWGDPSAVVLRCGVDPIGPTERPCVSPAGVDWVWIEHEDHTQLVTYGREPAVELLLDQDHVDESTMMNVQAALSGPVEQIEQTRECLPVDMVDSDDAG